jgi:hypothetical protein
MESLADDPKFRWRTPAVDACLRLADAQSEAHARAQAKCTTPLRRSGGVHALRVLAREVRALREENAELREEPQQQAREIAFQHALIERFKKLPDEWRLAAASVNDPRSPSIYVECAQDVDSVLDALRPEED